MFLTPECSADLKSTKKTKELAQAILKINPDVILLSEIGEKSAPLFCQDYLEGKYIHSLIPGNSDRGIHLCYLIKKGIPFEYQHKTHRNERIHFLYPSEISKNEELISQGKPKKYSSHRFSRDIAELRIKREGEEDPIMILLGVHLKSQLDSKGEDFEGKKRRGAEFKHLIKTYLQLKKKFKNTPIILLGDFNGLVNGKNPDPEFSPLRRETDLKDILELMDINLEDRVTHVTWSSKQKNLKRLQLDYIFLPPKIQGKIDPLHSGVYFYRDLSKEDQKRAAPKILDHTKLPSDHFPITCTFDLSNDA